MIKSICIVRLSALGDVLMLVPLVRTLQKNFPDVQLTWIISQPAYQLVCGMEGVEFILIDKPNYPQDYWTFWKQIKNRSFDVLLAAQASLRTNLLYPLIRAKRKIGYDNHRANDGHKWFINEQILPGFEHTLEGFLKFAQALGIKNPDVTWDLPITTEDFRWAEQHISKSQPLLIVNPAASKPERSWPVKNYIDVLKVAVQRWNVKIIISGGPGSFDKQLAAQIEKEVPALNLVGKTKPKQLLALIKNASVVLCPDTGPSHMAAAVNTPVIALHAVTNPLISGPYNFLNLVVNHYPEAAKKYLGNDHLEAIWGQHVHHPDCMKLILVEEVIEKLEQSLSPALSQGERELYEL